MSIRKKKKEIERLISAFEREADKFHDIKFSTFYITQETASEFRKFESPNHTIMLWQYYGNLDNTDDIEQLYQDMKNSDFKWGLKGAEFSTFAVVEGETCNLFARMAKRAGGVFNAKEADLIKSKLSEEFEKANTAGKVKPVMATNNNELAIWLNYLLYYISKVTPEKVRATRIEPDPFTLSLLALEDLYENPKVDKVDKSMKKVEDINFKVALSFPGEKRKYVAKVADQLRSALGNDQVFYDFDYQSQLAKPDLDTLLQNIYRNNSDLVVVFLCKEYTEKEWCGLEWRSIRDIIKSKDNDRIMFIRFDDADVSGVLSIDGYLDANIFSEEKIASFIQERIELVTN
ncbi:TIR domain-containing protein [Pseudoalteromonas sp. MMG005]|uniref:TIR domain-containing protein n=1 Tax=Pseudoalteromonas sp. MMG005 TaxID=2822682 RepID=UPI0032B3EAF8